MFEKMFFTGWTGVLRVLIVVTVALGSTLATVLLSKDVALSEGVTALGLLISLQYVVAWLSVRSGRVSQLVKAEPALLFYRGQFMRDAMRRERVTEEEVVAAVREQGVASLEGVEAVVLETAGTVSVLRATDREPLSALRGVVGVPPEDRGNPEGV